MKITKEFIRDTLEKNTGLVLNTRTRKREYINARAVYYELCKEYTMEPLSSIGGLLGKDHATVIHGRKVFATLEMYEPRFYKLYTDFKDNYPIDLYKVHTEEIVVSSEKDELMQKCQELYNQLQQSKIDLDVTATKYKQLKEEKERSLEGKFYVAIEELTDEQKDMAYERFLAMVSMIKSYKVY